MMPGAKGLISHELAHKWVKDLWTRDIQILGRIVEVRSTEQFAGIKSGLFTPASIYFYYSDLSLSQSNIPLLSPP